MVRKTILGRQRHHSCSIKAAKNQRMGVFQEKTKIKVNRIVSWTKRRFGEEREWNWQDVSTYILGKHGPHYSKVLHMWGMPQDHLLAPLEVVGPPKTQNIGCMPFFLRKTL